MQRSNILLITVLRLLAIQIHRHKLDGRTETIRFLQRRTLRRWWLRCRPVKPTGPVLSLQQLCELLLIRGMKLRPDSAFGESVLSLVVDVQYDCGAFVLLCRHHLIRVRLDYRTVEKAAC